MSIRDPNLLTGLEKASIVLIALGANTAAEVFKHLSELEIERLSAQIMKLRDIDSSVMDAVIAEFEQMCMASKNGAMGGKEFAAQVLEQAMGQEKANELIEKAGTAYIGRPFESLWQAEAVQIAVALGKEHPQIIALVLTYLPSEKAALVLSELSESIQTEVAHCICTLEETDPYVLTAIEEALNTKLSTAGAQTTSAGGPKTLVDILNNATRSTERLVLNSLNSQDPEVGEQVRKMMFVFEDLPKLDDRTVQIVLREIDQEDLRLALKGANDEIRELVFKNMSERAADMLKEDLELLTNVKATDMEACQQKIISVVRRLIVSGEAIMKDSEEEATAVEQSDQVELAA